MPVLGALDSLTGVIDLLETQTATRICLLSHNEGGTGVDNAGHAYRSAHRAFRCRPAYHATAVTLLLSATVIKRLSLL